MPRTIAPPVYEDRGYATPCLVWQGRPSAQGYARITEHGVTKPAHVVVWERKHGPVPAGHEVDHLCYVRMCVELTHLECVTKAENRSRAGVRMMSALTAGERSRQAHDRWLVRVSHGNDPTDHDLRARIRARRARGETWRGIAQAERCSLTTISRVLRHG